MLRAHNRNRAIPVRRAVQCAACDTQYRYIPREIRWDHLSNHRDKKQEPDVLTWDWKFKWITWHWPQVGTVFVRAKASVGPVVPWAHRGDEECAVVLTWAVLGIGGISTSAEDEDVKGRMCVTEESHISFWDSLRSWISSKEWLLIVNAWKWKDSISWSL